MPLGSANMTEDASVSRDTIAKTYPGMAYFAGTGPLGKKCGDCKFKGYHKISSRRRIDWSSVARGDWPEDLPARSYRVGGCQKYKQLAQIDGPPVDAHWQACKYFEQKDKK